MRVGAYDITTSAPALRSASPSLFYHTRSDTATTGEMKKTQEKSAFMQSLASYMDGIREGWRRMRGEVVKRTDIKPSEPTKHNASGRKAMHVAAAHSRRDTPVQHKERGSQTSFDKFLRSLPIVDAIDRTVDWVLAQPDNIEEREPDRFANLPDHALPRLMLRGSSRGGGHMSISRHEENLSSQVSLSRYESERGTVGRGTPPPLREGQPRLDLLLQQMHRHQERNALQRSQLEREHKLTCDVTTAMEQNQVTNQDMCGGSEMMVCGWGECRVAVPSRRQLMTHVTEHVQSGRAGRQLFCLWRGCDLPGRLWRNRISLQQHINRAHCNNCKVDKETVMVPHHLGIRYCDDGSKWNQDTTKPSLRRASITSIRRSANPRMTMVTGLQIRPAVVTKKNERRGNKRY